MRTLPTMTSDMQNKKGCPSTYDPYGSNKPSPKCQFENGKFKLRSLLGCCVNPRKRVPYHFCPGKCGQIHPNTLTHLCYTLFQCQMGFFYPTCSTREMAVNFLFVTSTIKPTISIEWYCTIIWEMFQQFISLSAISLAIYLLMIIVKCYIFLKSSKVRVRPALLLG